LSGTNYIQIVDAIPTWCGFLSGFIDVSPVSGGTLCYSASFA